MDQVVSSTASVTSSADKRKTAPGGSAVLEREIAAGLLNFGHLHIGTGEDLRCRPGYGNGIAVLL